MPLHRCALCHIDLDQVSVRRGGQLLLQDVSMHIHCGQLTVLIGQNGAGKSTLIRALLGEIPHGGAIRHVDSAGRDLAHLTTGYVPQHLSFDPEMPLTVTDFLASAFSRRPVWTGIRKSVRARVAEALADVNAAGLGDTPLGRCSGGELQRVLLALALHPAPDLLVLDEPVSGVDRNGLKMFLDTVTHLKETRHMAILLVSHDLRLVREYADHVVLLDKNVLAQGQPEAVFSSPAFESVFGTGAEKTVPPRPDVLLPEMLLTDTPPAHGGAAHVHTARESEAPQPDVLLPEAPSAHGDAAHTHAAREGEKSRPAAGLSRIARITSSPRSKASAAPAADPGAEKEADR